MQAPCAAHFVLRPPQKGLNGPDPKSRGTKDLDGPCNSAGWGRLGPKVCTARTQRQRPSRPNNTAPQIFNISPGVQVRAFGIPLPPGSRVPDAQHTASQRALLESYQQRFDDSAIADRTCPCGWFGCSECKRRSRNGGGQEACSGTPRMKPISWTTAVRSKLQFLATPQVSVMEPAGLMLRQEASAHLTRVLQ